MPDDDLIPTTDAARILGVLPRSARSTLHRYGVQAAGYVTTGGRAVAQFRRADVERVAASRPGRGSRTDLRRAMDRYTITLADDEMAGWLAKAVFAGNDWYCRVDGRTVTVDGTGLAVLAARDPEEDGHYDGMWVWVGGSEYPVDYAGPRWPLTRLAQAVNEATAREDVAALLPHLQALAADERVVEETRINLLTKAARVITPGAPLADTPAAALDVLFEAVAGLGSQSR